MFAIPYQPDRHLVRDIPFTHYLRNHYPDKNCMTYFHLDTGNWIAGVWIRDKKFIQEIVCLGPNPGEITREHARKFDAFVHIHGVDMRWVRNMLMGLERSHLRHLDEQQALRQQGLDKMRHLCNDHWKDHPALSVGAVYGAHQ